MSRNPATTAPSTAGHAGHGMDEDHQVLSQGEHAGHSTAMFRRRFWVSLPVLHVTSDGAVIGAVRVERTGSARNPVLP